MLLIRDIIKVRLGVQEWSTDRRSEADRVGQTSDPLILLIRVLRLEGIKHPEVHCLRN